MQAPVGSFTVASFNTHWGVDRRGRPYDVVRACIDLDVDVLVLQEVWRPHGGPTYVDEVAERLGARCFEVAMMSDRNPAKPRGLRLPEGRPGTCGLAVLARVPVLQVDRLVLPHAPGDVIERRHAIAVSIALGSASAEGKERAVVAGMHASHRLWGSLPQVRTVHRVLTDSGNPSVIAGDLNMWGPAVRTVLRGRRRAVRGRTWPAHRPHSQIDHLWIDDRLRVVEACVGDDVGSDHRAVRARLAVR